MTLLYLTLAWIGGVLLGHLLWQAGRPGCATPAWALGLPAGLAILALLAGTAPGAAIDTLYVSTPMLKWLFRHFDGAAHRPARLTLP